MRHQLEPRGRLLVVREAEEQDCKLSDQIFRHHGPDVGRRYHDVGGRPKSHHRNSSSRRDSRWTIVKLRPQRNGGN